MAVILSLVLPTAVWGHLADEGGVVARWDWRLDVLLVLALSGTIYTTGWRRLRSRYPRIAPRWQLGLYLAGLGSIFLALVSPIDVLADEILTMHMVQHLLLLMTGPLFLLLANPLPASLWGIPKKPRYSVSRLLVRGSYFRHALRFLTLMPVSWTLYVANLWAWHHPFFYQAALRNQRVHDLEHLMYFFTGLLFWWPIANPAPRLHKAPSYGTRIAYLMAATLQNTLLGMAIALPERVLYPFYAAVPGLRYLSPINDQALGGGIMWECGHLYLLPILFLLARFVASEREAG